MQNFTFNKLEPENVERLYKRFLFFSADCLIASVFRRFADPRLGPQLQLICKLQHYNTFFQLSKHKQHIMTVRSVKVPAGGFFLVKNLAGNQLPWLVNPNNSPANQLNTESKHDFPVSVWWSSWRFYQHSSGRYSPASRGEHWTLSAGKVHSVISSFLIFCCSHPSTNEHLTGVKWRS